MSGMGGLAYKFAQQSDVLLFIASDVPLGMLQDILMLGHRQVNATLTAVKTVLYSDNALNIRRQSADRLPTNTIGHVYGSISQTERMPGVRESCPLAMCTLRYSRHPTETCRDYATPTKLFSFFSYNYRNHVHYRKMYSTMYI